MSKNQTIDCQRALFDIPENIAYLNCAYMSPLMGSVVAAMEKGTQGKVHPWTYTPPDFVAPSEAFRKLSARLINASPDDIALIPSVSYGVQVAANNLPLSKNGEILVLDEQFPSNVYSWQEKAKQARGRICTVKRPTNGDWTSAVLEAINTQTQILALPANHWADGGCLDLETIAKSARKMGAALVLDLTQSLGAMPFDVQKVQPDYMISACYKWLMGPYTMGMMYIAPKWQGGVPLEQTWMGRKGSENFAGLVDYQDAYQMGARRFDMGEKSNAGQVNGASAAMTQLLEWGVENIAYTLGTRNAKLAARARDLGLSVPQDKYRSPHYLGLGFAKGIPDGLLAACTAQNIFVSARGNAVRVTPHLYNTDADIERLFAVLEGAVA